MARTPDKDKLQSFRFRVFEVAGGADVFANEAPVAGFTSVTVPGITIEMSEHRTGTEDFAHKYPGIANVEDATMTRGIYLGDTTFYNWVMAKVLGGEPFRTDLEIRIYNQQKPGRIVDDPHSRRVICHDCFPTTVKLIGDLDASSSDVNVQEITCAVERVTLDAPATV